jgi:type II secretory pathway pseudopilin PulG
MEALRPGEKRWFLLSPRKRDSRAGLTLIELIVAFTILLILSTMALPLARIRVQRDKERRLRDALTEMRKAIDRYKDYADAGKLGQIDPESHGYPESLEMLVEGVELSDANGMGADGMNGGSNFGTPMGQGSRSNRNSGLGSSNRSSGFGSSGGGFGSNRSSGFGSNRSSGFGSSNRSGGFGSNRNSGFGSNRNSSGIGGTQGIGGADGTAAGDEDDGKPQKIRFLRRIPVDPITGTAEWGMRSIKDPPESMSWGGRTVFDVYSKSMDAALDGTHYNEW